MMKIYAFKQNEIGCRCILMSIYNLTIPLFNQQIVEIPRDISMIYFMTNFKCLLEIWGQN